MAGEIAHVVYAARLLSHLGNKISNSSYWAGALFPNIRKIDAISRHPIHPRTVTLATIQGSNDFITGMRVHAWIDDTQDHYMKREHISEHLPNHPLTPHAFALLEDELLYDAYSNWNVVHRALNAIHHDELQYVHNQAHVQAWHNVLQTYLREKPTDESRISFSRAIGLSSATGEETNILIKKLRNIPQTHSALEGYLHELEYMLG